MSAILNQNLLESQQVSDKQQDTLHNLYEELSNLMDNELDTNPEEFGELITDLEYKLQENWNFPKNIDYHKYLFESKRCSCAKLDNFEKLGTPYKIITQGCPYHDKYY